MLIDHIRLEESKNNIKRLNPLIENENHSRKEKKRAVGPEQLFQMKLTMDELSMYVKHEKSKHFNI